MNIDKQAILDAIRKKWIEDYGTLDEPYDEEKEDFRNGCFVLGFVGSVLNEMEKEDENTKIN